MSFFGIDATKNLSYLTVPAVFMTCLVPHMYAVGSSGKVYDNANPRGFRDALSKSQLDKPLQQRIARALGASQNGFETLGVFAGGVIAANQAGLATKTLNTLAIGYLCARVAYVYTYIHLGANRKFSILRSALFAVSVGFCMSLWVKAGLNAM
ncbi:hypothetical protein QQS21_009415 [Conoideocrella luteorostrata]|uniref:Uncharacterized protein n=1 Tax=Conoideocrella luteorostrata TaxID=1105319 RepID=A0AAJ0CGY4_9HYPO|nr:hypothetical protein QQS21_009415 [Conoideocrella luteorostrata]